MRRRDFIKVFAGSTAFWPIGAQAQQSNRMRRVSVLLGLSESDPETKARVKAFRLGMRDLGWIEGHNIQIDYRFAGTNTTLIKEYVSESVSSLPDVIVANTTPVMSALRPATNTIPIVFAVVNDPVGQGFITNLARPGRNITGFSFIEPEIVGKWINLLSSIKPNLARIALMFNPDTTPYYDSYLRSFKALPHQSSVEVYPKHVRTPEDIDRVIAKLGDEPDSGLIAPADAYVLAARAAILKAADQYRVPLITPYKHFVAEGALMSYGPDTSDIFRRSSSYVDRILKGEQVGNLPAQSPDKFELAINLKTAKTLGLSVRESFLLLADEIIE